MLSRARAGDIFINLGTSMMPRCCDRDITRAGHGPWRLLGIGLAMWMALHAGCRQDMAEQPRYDPLEASAFFADGKSARHLVPDTVARGHLPESTPFVTGKDASGPVETLPMDVSLPLFERGKERYEIFCVPCHDQLGSGQGMIVQRGFPRPPSFHNGALREAPVGHFFDVITHGFGALMPAYGSKIPPEDRWAIIAYIRALQFSQYAPVADLPAALRQRIQESSP